jgi:hypothetical protein
VDARGKRHPTLLDADEAHIAKVAQVFHQLMAQALDGQREPLVLKKYFALLHCATKTVHKMGNSATPGARFFEPAKTGFGVSSICWKREKRNCLNLKASCFDFRIEQPSKLKTQLEKIRSPWFNLDS